MPGQLQSRCLLIATAGICFTVTLIALAGLILREDAIGRVIFGAAWTALGVVWLGRLAVIAKREQRGS